MNKRRFVRTLGGASLGLLFGAERLAAYARLAPETLAEDETFWATIQGMYRLTPDYINLENGYYMRTRQYDDNLPFGNVWRQWRAVRTKN